MTPLDPRHLTLLRLNWLIAAVILLPFIVAADFTLTQRGWLSAGVATGAGVLLLILAIWLAPRRRYHAWGYMLGEDELSVKHGLLVRQLTIVPFGRVQHIDVARGPLQRLLGLATLILNTAGTRGSAVRLPGLRPEQAEAMRDHVRAKIRLDLV